MLQQRIRPGRLLAAALLVLAVALAGGSLQAAVPISGPSPYSDGGNPDDPAAVTLCNGEPQLGVVYRNSETEPHLAVNPTNPDNMIAAWHQDRWSTGGAQGVWGAYTMDGGDTWSPVEIPFTRCSGAGAGDAGDFGRASDPWISFGPDGTAYTMALVFDASRDRNAMAVATSFDGGSTWEDPVLIVVNESQAGKGRSPFHDKNTITADPHQPGVVYATWVVFRNRNQSQLFARSTDWGRTWKAVPVNHREVIAKHVSTNVRQGSQIVVLPDGTLLNFFFRGITDPRKGGTFLGFEEAVFRSRTGGRTWDRLDTKIGDIFPFVINEFVIYSAVDAELQMGIRDAGSIPEVAVNRATGDLYVVWQDSRFNPVGLIGSVISRSTDGGVTWSDPLPVNTVPNPLAQAFLPTVAVTDDGTVGVLYYDFRNDQFGDPELHTDVHLAVFDRDLNRLGEVTLTESSFDMRQMLITGFQGFFPGDYVGLDTAGDDFVAAFTRSNNLGLPVEFPQPPGLRVDRHHRQDIVYSRVVSGSWAGSGARPAPRLRPMVSRTDLHAVAPNPFSSRALIRFDLAEEGPVNLEIFDIAGRKVRGLVDESRSRGGFSEHWDGRDGSGRRVADGIYFYRLTTREFSQTRRMVLVR